MEATVLQAPAHCQTFPQGCVGCCVNRRWTDTRIRMYLARNTAQARARFASGRPGYWTLVRMHWWRGGFWDHLLMVWLVMPSFGLSALVWSRFFASCPFAGYLDERTGRVGCLIHPLRVGAPDPRRHAFPLIPTASCNRALRCPMLDHPNTDFTSDALRASRSGAESLRHPGARRRWV